MWSPSFVHLFSQSLLGESQAGTIVDTRTVSLLDLDTWGLSVESGHSRVFLSPPPASAIPSRWGVPGDKGTSPSNAHFLTQVPRIPFLEPKPTPYLHRPLLWLHSTGRMVPPVGKDHLSPTGCVAYSHEGVLCAWQNQGHKGNWGEGLVFICTLASAPQIAGRPWLRRQSCWNKPPALVSTCSDRKGRELLNKQIKMPHMMLATDKKDLTTVK